MLTASDQAGRTYELAADPAFTFAELAAEVSRQSGKTIIHNDLSEADYRDVLTGAGLPADLAALLADADAAASRGALFDDGGALGRLIGRPTTSMQGLVAASLHGARALGRCHVADVQAHAPAPAEIRTQA